MYPNQQLSQSVFLSTLSLRRATASSPARPAWQLYFYPRSPCGERRAAARRDPAQAGISIHALLAESDYNIIQEVITNAHFYPRSPCGERP